MKYVIISMIVLLALSLILYKWKDGLYQDEKASREEYQRLYQQCGAEFEHARLDWDSKVNDYESRLKEARPIEAKVKQEKQAQVIYVTKEAAKDNSSERKLQLIDDVLCQEWK